MSPSATLGHSLLLLALCQSSLSWDSSNIWFPDTNNPVFYNMTFYQQAALQSVDTENLIPPTEPPRIKNSNRQRPRPAVFNPLPEPSNTRAPLRPTETPRTPDRTRRPSVPMTNGRMQGPGDSQSGISRLGAEQEAFIRNEQNHQRGRNSGQSGSVTPQSGISRLGAEQEAFIRNEQNRQRVKNVAPQSGNRRSSTDQQNMIARNERPGLVSVGYKTVPLEATTSSRSQFYEEGSQHLAGNRLRRTKNDNIADGGNRFGGGETRWSGNRDAVLRQADNNGVGYERDFQKAVDPAERRWNSAGTANGRDATNRVEENVITDIGRSSKVTGPSKCVWAIISCCKPSSTQIRYTCFESLGCHGAFWDTNPCSKEMTQAVVKATANFYNIPSRNED